MEQLLEAPLREAQPIEVLAAQVLEYRREGRARRAAPLEPQRRGVQVLQQHEVVGAGAVLDARVYAVQVRIAACFLGRGDFVEDGVVIAGQKIPAVDHHVDLIRAIVRRASHFLKFQSQRHQSGWKSRRDRSHLHVRASEKFFREAHHVWINANRGA